MTTVETAAWAAATAAWVALAVYAYWIAGKIWRDTLLRCPETAAITLVGIRHAAGGTEVHRCGLWPDRVHCSRGCLARYAETAPGYRVNLEALRPFERR